jgi:hypothetical protein
MHLHLELEEAPATGRQRQGSKGEALAPLKSPLYRTHAEQWEDDEQEDGGDWVSILTTQACLVMHGYLRSMPLAPLRYLPAFPSPNAPQASEGGDDDRQADFLDLDGPDEPLDGGRRSLGATPGALSPSLPGFPAPSPVEGLASPVGSPVPLQFVSKGIPAPLLLQMETWATALAASGQGLLFENETLQVGRSWGR